MSITYVAGCNECDAVDVVRIKNYKNVTYIGPPAGWMMSTEQVFICRECSGGVDPYECDDCTPTTFPPPEGDSS